MKKTLGMLLLLLMLTSCSSTKNDIDNNDSDSDINIPDSRPVNAYLEDGLYGDEEFILKMRSMNDEDTGTKYYVSQNGSDINDGTLTSPFKTIKHALDLNRGTLEENVFIYILEGEYAEHIDLDGIYGNSNAYLKLTSYNDDLVSIKAVERDNISLGDSSYIWIDSLVVKDNVGENDPVALRMDEGNDHIIISNNKFTNIKTTKPKEESGFVIYINGENEVKANSNILIYNNELIDCQTGWSEAIEVVANCEYVNVIANKVTRTGNIGIDIGGNFGYCTDKSKDQARYVLVRGNEVSYGRSEYGATSYGIYVDGARDVIIERNISHDNLGGIEVGSEERVAEYPVKNVIVRNNLVYHNEENGITVGGYTDTVGVVYNVEIYNNTVVDNGYTTDHGWNGQLTLSMLDGIKIMNNIFYVSFGDFPLVQAPMNSTLTKNVVFKSNLYYNTQNEDGYFELFDNGYDSFSSFKDFTGEDGFYVSITFTDDLYHSDYQYIKDKGTNIDSSVYDLDGNKRIDNIIDLGCYEYIN